jgi:hypothetical protein
VINVVLAFYMGTDMASILDSPIEQPMAAVRNRPLSSQYYVALLMYDNMLDFLQQLRKKRHACRVGGHHCCTVSHQGCRPWCSLIVSR